MSAILHILREMAGALLRQSPDLIATFYGVLLGGLATLGIVRWQLNEERRSREGHDKEFLVLLVEHVNREIAKNLRTFRELIAAAGQSDVPRTEMWDWVVTIAGSFASQAHDDLYRTGLQRYLPGDFEEQIRSANAIVFDAAHRVRQARAEHIFNAAYRDDERQLNEKLLVEVRSLLPRWLDGLETADRAVSPTKLPWMQVQPARRKRARRRLLRKRLFRLGRRG